MIHVDNSEKRKVNLTSKNIAIIGLILVIWVAALWYFLIPKAIWGLDSCMIDSKIKLGERTEIIGCDHSVVMIINKETLPGSTESLVINLIKIDGKNIVPENSRENMGMAFSYHLRGHALQAQSYMTNGQTMYGWENPHLVMSIWFTNIKESEADIKIVFHFEEAK